MTDSSAFPAGVCLCVLIVCVFVSNEKRTLPTTALENVDLRDQIISLQEEKKALAIELENLRSKLAEEIVDVSIVSGKQRVGECDVDFLWLVFGL